MVIAALAPLGERVCAARSSAGLRGRWCDRYENRGKQSGAFSAGSYDGDPYILMNYQPDVLDHVFTLAHEAGHSMHSYLSAQHQPFHYYDYAIFVAEVASTFNEQLLSRHLLDHAGDDRQRAFLVNRQIDAMRGTIFRQTMFAEFEKIAHETAEAGEPLTVDRFREIYHGLLERYFGPDFTLDAELDLECLRIPHFYRGFYVYKYATGMSAAIALANRVLGGGRASLDDYLGLLRGGSSKDPLDLLRDAGVDMEQPAGSTPRWARSARWSSNSTPWSAEPAGWEEDRWRGRQKVPWDGLAGLPRSLDTLDLAHGATSSWGGQRGQSPKRGCSSVGRATDF